MNRQEDGTRRQTKLVFVSSDAGSTKVVEDALSEAAWGITRSSTSLAEALAHLEPDTALVVTYPTPLLFLASRMKQGVSPRDALAAWKEATVAMLKSCRLVRGQIALVDQLALLERPVQVRTALAARFRIEIKPSTDEAASWTLGGNSPLHLAFAVALLNTDEEIASLVDELEALTVGPATGTKLQKLAIVQAALDQIRHETEIEQMRIQLSDELFSQLFVATHELQLSSDEATQDGIDAAARFESALSAERERGSKAQAKLIKENNRLQETAFDAEVSALVLARREKLLEEELAQLNRRYGLEKARLDKMLHDAHKEIQALRRSTSWKVTEPLRIVGRRLKRTNTSP